MARRAELAEFLRSRRARLTPAQLGLPSTGRRRTPGLRREEVATLAGLSVTYYTWLEQARDVRPSQQVVTALGAALRLDGTERAHLCTLAGLPAPARRPDPRPHPTLAALVSTLDPNPAYVIDHRWDVLAYNRGEAALIGDLAARPAAERNIVWLVFTDPALRTLLVDWDEEARLLLARFRLAAAEHAGDARFAELIGALRRVSPEFDTWWPRHDIRGHAPERKRFRHPELGELCLDYIRLRPPEHPEHNLLVYLPADPATRAALDRLATADIP